MAVIFIIDLISAVLSKPFAMGIANGQLIHNDKVIYQANNLKIGLIKGEGSCKVNA